VAGSGVRESWEVLRLWAGLLRANPGNQYVNPLSPVPPLVPLCQRPEDERAVLVHPITVSDAGKLDAAAFAGPPRYPEADSTNFVA
jgi:hypothetical protein